MGEPEGTTPAPRVRPLFQIALRRADERPVRVPFRLPVRFREKRRVQVEAQGVVVNVSQTGMYVAVRHPPGIQDIVTLVLPGDAVDGDERPLRLRGQVRWWRHTRARNDESLGFGVKILDFPEPEHRDRYRAFVSRLTAGTAPSPPGAPPPERDAARPEGPPSPPDRGKR